MITRSATRQLPAQLVTVIKGFALHDLCPGLAANTGSEGRETSIDDKEKVMAHYAGPSASSCVSTGSIST
jgi:hypothetical protein